MAKYKRKTSNKRNTLWTEEDRAHLRSLHYQGVSARNIGKLLDRSEGSIHQQIYHMRKKDAAEGYVHVFETPTPAPLPLSETEMNAKLRGFTLFEERPAPKPSLWARIRGFFKL
jgi:hypothetical protein